MEVPDRATASFPVPTAAAWIADPGAEMSGFRSFVSRAGPSDVKLVIASTNAGFSSTMSEIDTLTVPSLNAAGAFGLSTSRIASASSRPIMKDGIVRASPFVARATGAPPALLRTTTAIAPASCALKVFVDCAQKFRKTTTTSPSSELAGSGLQKCCAVLGSTSRPSNRSTLFSPPAGIGPDHD